jgi:hypothetical protein
MDTHKDLNMFLFFTQVMNTISDVQSSALAKLRRRETIVTSLKAHVSKYKVNLKSEASSFSQTQRSSGAIY